MIINVSRWRCDALIVENEKLIRQQALSAWLPSATVTEQGSTQALAYDCSDFAKVNAPTRMGIVLAICILLLAHSGFRYILLVPLTSHLETAIVVAVEAVVVIIPRTPQRGIVVAPTPAPSASPASSAPIGVKVVSAEGAEAIRKLIATSSNVEMTASPR